MRVLVTGASGFIGSHVVGALHAADADLTLLGGTRVPLRPDGEQHRAFAPGAIEDIADLSPYLKDCDTVVHLAGRAHILRESSDDPVAAFNAANAVAVEKLCAAMETNGVRYLVLMSSIKANDHVFPYGKSKLAGEGFALAFAKRRLKVTILRPCLVYGVGAAGNLQRLIGLIQRGIPLPFASVINRRSLCSVDNLASAVVTAVMRKPDGPGIFEICDDEVLSLPDIVRSLADGLGRGVRMLPFPQGVLYGVARRVSAHAAEGLFGDLVLDNSAFKSMFSWAPEVRTHDGLKEVGRAARTAQ